MTLQATITLAFVVAGLLLLGAGWLAISAGRAYLAGDARTDRMHAAQLELAQLQVSLRAAESSVRGYVVTGEPEFVAALEPTLRDVELRIAGVRRLLDDAPAYLGMFDEVAGHVRLRAGMIQALTDTRRTQGFDAAQRIVAEGAGRQETARVTALVEAVARGLDDDIAREASHSQARYQATIAGVTLQGLLTFAVLLMAWLVVRREEHARRRLAERLEREANHDPLTALPNRRFFTEWLGYALAHGRREGTGIGLLMIDLDGFKAINDRDGHQAGDKVLAAVATRFRAAKREYDVLARIGGDEFALAAPGARDGREIAVLAQRLIDALVDPARPPLSPLPLGVSIGVAFFPDDADDLPGLVAAADAAMYAAKRAGGNRIAFAGLTAP
jgi:diguanylate cyclase (GGDEF)-like protein